MSTKMPTKSLMPKPQLNFDTTQFYKILY